MSSFEAFRKVRCSWNHAPSIWITNSIPESFWSPKCAIYLYKGREAEGKLLKHTKSNVSVKGAGANTSTKLCLVFLSVIFSLNTQKVSERLFQLNMVCFIFGSAAAKPSKVTHRKDADSS